mmetsp:Transcript_6282/g.15024  ORF Transcript_6282/g.15024 Transcript_6282/m.15024 type:complete len:225 (+) Transcript_6282:3-677(+)
MAAAGAEEEEEEGEGGRGGTSGGLGWPNSTRCPRRSNPCFPWCRLAVVSVLPSAIAAGASNERSARAALAAEVGVGSVTADLRFEAVLRTAVAARPLAAPRFEGVLRIAVAALGASVSTRLNHARRAGGGGASGGGAVFLGEDEVAPKRPSDAKAVPRAAGGSERGGGADCVGVKPRREEADHSEGLEGGVLASSEPSTESCIGAQFPGLQARATPLGAAGWMT